MNVTVKKGDSVHPDAIIQIGDVVINNFDDEVAIIIPDGDGISVFSLGTTDDYGYIVSARVLKRTTTVGELLDHLRSCTHWTEEVTYHPSSTVKVTFSV